MDGWEDVGEVVPRVFFFFHVHSTEGVSWWMGVCVELGASLSMNPREVEGEWDVGKKALTVCGRLQHS